MKKGIKFLTTLTLVLGLLFSANAASFAKSNITPKSVVAGGLSLLIWPGIGQAVNDNKGEKVLTHAVIGILPPFRFWSCYDAVVNRKKGYWDGRI